jgi:hypothetical protein
VLASSELRARILLHASARIDEDRGTSQPRCGDDDPERGERALASDVCKTQRPKAIHVELLAQPHARRVG